MSAPGPWRIAIVSTVAPVVERLVPVLRELGHEPVGFVVARGQPGDPPNPAALTPENAPPGLDVLYAHRSGSMERLLRALEPDLMLCWGFPWKIPQAALDVAPLGSVNLHPALLPRHRGPIPIAWAFRSGEGEIGITWHRMDAELDTGGILAQSSVPIEPEDAEITDVAPRLGAAACGLLPRVFERIAAGDPGDPQDHSQASWAGHFEQDDYAEIDWSQPAARIHDQVRAWRLTFDLGPARGPWTELDGERVKVMRTSLRDPGNGARRVECGDGPIWVVATEPAGGTGEEPMTAGSGSS